MLKKEKIIIIAGEFDPLDAEEIKILQKCKKKCDWLVVGVHSDWFMSWSHGGFLQNQQTRKEIVTGLRSVDEVFSFDDTDGTVCHLLKLTKSIYPGANIIYVSSEDMKDMPETKIKGIRFETVK